MFYVKEANSKADILKFREKLRDYHIKDIFHNDFENEDLSYFLSDEYWNSLVFMHDREDDRVHFLTFYEDDKEIGLSLFTLYDRKDFMGYIMEFEIYEDFRGKGLGHTWAKELINYAKSLGCKYFALGNSRDVRRREFWLSLGFIDNGTDEWGNPEMVYLLNCDGDLEYKALSTKDEYYELLRPISSFLTEMDRDIPDEEKKESLLKAIENGSITFYIAKKLNRIVGILSVTSCYSLIEGKDISYIDNIYVEPLFRNKGILGKLMEFTFNDLKSKDISNVSVISSYTNFKMYQTLGFTEIKGGCLTKTL